MRVAAGLRLPSVEGAAVWAFATLAIIVALAILLVGCDALASNLAKFSLATLALCVVLMLCQLGARFLRWTAPQPRLSTARTAFPGLPAVRTATRINERNRLPGPCWHRHRYASGCGSAPSALPRMFPTTPTMVHRVSLRPN